MNNTQQHFPNQTLQSVVIEDRLMERKRNKYKCHKKNNKSTVSGSKNWMKSAGFYETTQSSDEDPSVAFSGGRILNSMNAPRDLPFRLQ